MKKIVSVTEVDGEGLVALLGERVTLFCLNYIYEGRLSGVNEACVLLEDAAIVYETGPFSGTEFKDAQPIANVWYVQRSAIESFGRVGLVRP